MDSWMRGFISTRASLLRHLDRERLAAGHRELVPQLLARSRVRVAVPEGHPDLILGWAACEADCVHWLYVKKSFRRQGIATVLLEDAAPLRLYSHATKPGHVFLRERLGLQLSPGHAYYPPARTA